MTTITIDRTLVEQALRIVENTAYPLARSLIKALRAALEEPQTCVWQQDSDTDSGVYGTSCGHYFNLEDGTPEDNEMQWCCYCGKKLAQELIEENNDD